MNKNLILCLNSGSSSLKFGVFTGDEHAIPAVARGAVDLSSLSLRLSPTQGQAGAAIPLNVATDEPEGLLRSVLEYATPDRAGAQIKAIAHRVVHGGTQFTGPTKVDLVTLAALERLTPLAPLHQPQSLAFIRAAANLCPGVPQTASFDIAFHATIAPLVQRFALPRSLHDSGFRRYGFHGLAYSSMLERLRQLAPSDARRKVIAAHLGSGASLCAIENSTSRDTSMGFSTLDGVPMATRCGALDPGVVLSLLREEKQTLQDVEELLYRRSGLLGVSGASGDTRALLAATNLEAKEAMDIYTFRIAGEFARLAATLGGIDVIVFSGGVGEHQPEVRAMIANRMRWLGVRLNPCANARNEVVISALDSAIRVYVISVDEESVLARDAHNLLTSTDHALVSA